LTAQSARPVTQLARVFQIIAPGFLLLGRRADGGFSTSKQGCFSSTTESKPAHSEPPKGVASKIGKKIIVGTKPPGLRDTCRLLP
tara:strand:- start:105262 stop:105516 length:255 start_codon:yes stop_codon:yes gene_type:complete